MKGFSGMKTFGNHCVKGRTQIKDIDCYFLGCDVMQSFNIVAAVLNSDIIECVCLRTWCRGDDLEIGHGKKHDRENCLMKSFTM
jgi:hypothetical protein